MSHLRRGMVKDRIISKRLETYNGTAVLSSGYKVQLAIQSERCTLKEVTQLSTDNNNNLPSTSHRALAEQIASRQRSQLDGIRVIPNRLLRRTTIISEPCLRSDMLYQSREPRILRDAMDQTQFAFKITVQAIRISIISDAKTRTEKVKREP